MIGPFSVILYTIRMDRTTMKTEQKDRQNWHLCRPISLHVYLIKKRSFWQHDKLLEPSSSSSQ